MKVSCESDAKNVESADLMKRKGGGKSKMG
jgi:hypothetical protein